MSVPFIIVFLRDRTYQSIEELFDPLVVIVLRFT